MSEQYFLNEGQKKAASHKDGPLLVIAGAGAGKTKTISVRISELIGSGISPSNILALTFTNKAAREMRERVTECIKDSGKSLNLSNYYNPSNPFIGTFHSLGRFILNEYANRAGLKRNFPIRDKEESLSLIKKGIVASDLDPKQFEPRKIQSIISKAKGNLISDIEFGETTGDDFLLGITAGVWNKYEELLTNEGSCDFDDLILKTVILLKNNRGILNTLLTRWTHIHIDEYQDTNISQYELARLLAGKSQNICVVGDGDQSIYGWRGADYRNIQNFENNFKNTTSVTLSQNYRSTKNILSAANSIISKNINRKEKDLYTIREAGEPISIYIANDENDEASFVAEKTNLLIKSGIKEKNIAVLYRANFQSRVMEEKFLEMNIPYQVLGVRFFDRKEVKDVVAYIRTALNHNDFTSLERILNVPRRGIGKVSAIKILSGRKDTLPLSMQKKVDKFYELLNKIENQIIEKPISSVISFIVKYSGMQNELNESGDEGLERLENVKELVTLAKKYDELGPERGLEQFLDDVSLMTSDQDSMENNNNAVRLMTAHASKGLEFKHVFIVGLEEGLFPHGGFDEDKDPEEERRLFYVAITRAEDKVYLSYANSRTIFGKKEINLPSEFIFDIDDSLFEECKRNIDELKTISI